MAIQSQKDFFSGLMFTIVGVGFAVGATSYTIGDGARMGPGYFPLVLGVLLALLGAAITVQSLVLPSPDGGKIGAWAWRPLLFIILSNVVFGVLLGGLPSVGLPPMGMVLAIYALTIIASLADGHFKPREVLVLATILALGSYLAFVVLLKLQFPVWPPFITG